MQLHEKNAMNQVKRLAAKTISNMYKKELFSLLHVKSHYNEKTYDPTEKWAKATESSHKRKYKGHLDDLKSAQLYLQ